MMPGKFSFVNEGSEFRKDWIVEYVAGFLGFVGRRFSTGERVSVFWIKNKCSCICLKVPFSIKGCLAFLLLEQEKLVLMHSSK